jgi:IS605 OrfB family transposase
LKEYSKVVNFFIDEFWDGNIPKKSELLKPIVDLPNTWLSSRFRKVAAREALDLISSAKELEGSKPVHSGKTMNVSSTIATFKCSKKSKHFDCWLELRSIGKSIKLDLPIKLHKHFNQLYAQGKRLNSYIITPNYVQFCFEINTKEKKEKGELVGVDIGINKLVSLSNGKEYGKDVKSYINVIKRCKHGSKRQKRKRNALKQYFDKIVKDIYKENDLRLVVVEGLKKLNDKSKLKRRLSRNIRRSIGIWNYRYFLNRFQQGSEINRVSFRTVNPRYTSQQCFKCGYTNRRNRRGEVFSCRSCGHQDDADANASKNILIRFLTGPYGAGFKPQNLDEIFV